MNSLGDDLALRRLDAEMRQHQVEVLLQPRWVRARALEGGHEGTLVAREHRGEQGWWGLVCLEREYLPGWFHLVVLWLPAARVQVLPDSVPGYALDWLASRALDAPDVTVTGPIESRLN